MKKSKMICAMTVISACGILCCAAAQAKTVELNYMKDGEKLDFYTYSSNSGCADYTLDEDSQSALAAAQDGDKVIITYTITSEGQSNNRCGLRFDRLNNSSSYPQFYVNASNKTERNKNVFTDTGCHLNGDFVKNDTGNVKYEIELNGGGTVKAITASLEIGGSTAIYENITERVSGIALTNIRLNSASRNNSSYTAVPELSDFSAQLETVDPQIYDAEEYTDYTNDPELAESDAKGYTAEISVKDGYIVNSLEWYIKNSTGEYNKLTSGKLPVISQGMVKAGLIIYDIPEGIDASDISVGYTYGFTEEDKGAE